MAAEKRFENKVKKFLEENGCYYIKHFSNAFTKSGIPDILACVDGHFLGIEVKAENGKPSALQLHNLKMIDEASGYAFLLYPDDFETFKEIIHLIKKGFFMRANCEYWYLKQRWCELANEL